MWTRCSNRFNLVTMKQMSHVCCDLLIAKPLNNLCVLPFYQAYSELTRRLTSKMDQIVKRYFIFVILPHYLNQLTSVCGLRWNHAQNHQGAASKSGFAGTVVTMNIAADEKVNKHEKYATFLAKITWCMQIKIHNCEMQSNL